MMNPDILPKENFVNNKSFDVVQEYRQSDFFFDLPFNEEQTILCNSFKTF